MKSSSITIRYLLCFIHSCIFLFAVTAAFSQNKQAPSVIQYDTAFFGRMQWRCIGPFRGGRVAAVTGVRGQSGVFYFGSTGGGVWKTTDGGANWKNSSDPFFGGSIGAVAVSESDPNVIYAGGGEKTVRGNVSHGYGIWKSSDAGKTWKQSGLKDSRHMPRIKIHPSNPDLVYTAALGHLFGPNEERGLYRSKDGGKTWERILFVNNKTGAIDLAMDPSNPRILFASMWEVKRTPYSLESGGTSSGLWKSTDGGDTWKQITHNKGLPADSVIGIIGVTISPVKPDRIWAIVEAKEGGVFRSDDGGETWTKTNGDRSLRQRAWYYSRIYADTRDEDILYVLNVQFHKSKDGGKTFTTIPTAHSDHHDLWIDPDDSKRIMIGHDGGAQVTLDGAANWSSINNQPTAQFYRVVTDTYFPYRIYGAQQDNSTVRILHRSSGGSITEQDWEETAGGESGHIAADPTDPDIVYGGSYGGYLTRINHKTGEERNINVWPENPMGWGAKDLKFRFQWNFPIFFSPHDAKTLYAAGNVLFKSTNEGQSWEAISPDLTRNDSTKMGASGGPITKDNTSVEYYGTIFAAAESPYEKGVIWTGSDDGHINLTTDGGKSWNNVTPKEMPGWMMINSIEPNPFVKGGAYIAGTRYKSDDFQPYLYKTTDYGKTWTKITAGIDKEHFTRVLRADPKRAGLLYAGTESGMYISFDDGISWKPFNLNLPIVPITDLTLKENDLIAATQGRSFWVLDDLTRLHQLTGEMIQSSVWLFKPRAAWRIPGFNRKARNAGENPQSGVVITYYLKNKPDTGSTTVRIEILQEDDKVIRSWQTKAKKKEDQLEPAKGMNQFVWNMRYPDAVRFDDMILWSGGVQGPMAVPGTYKVKLTVGEKSIVSEFEIKADPRLKTSRDDYKAQFEFLTKVRDKLTDTHKAILKIRSIRDQVDQLTRRMGKDTLREINEAAKALNKKLTAVEEALYQTKNKSSQDPLNYPIRLNDKLSGLNSSAPYRPTQQMVEVFNELSTKINSELDVLKKIIETDLIHFNALVKKNDVPAVIVKEEN